MTQIIFDAAVTLNGFLADENHSLQWLFDVPGAEDPDPELLPQNVGVQVMGANTYLWMLDNDGFAETPDAATVVFTSRKLPVPEGINVQLANGPVAEMLPRLRQMAGEQNVWVMGGGDLLGQFLDAGALDILALTIAPAALAAGAPLLPRTIGSRKLELVEARKAGPFARLSYKVL